MTERDERSAAPDSKPRRPSYRGWLSAALALISLLSIVGFLVVRHIIATDTRGDLVRQLDVNLPTNQKQARDTLWTIGRGCPPVKHTFPPVSDWKEDFQQRREAILQEAQALGFDDHSLDEAWAKALKHADKEKLAYRPIRAYLIRQGARPVWVLAVGWEYRKSVERGEPMSHIRHFAYDGGSVELVGFSTCD